MQLVIQLCRGESTHMQAYSVVTQSFRLLLLARLLHRPSALGAALVGKQHSPADRSNFYNAATGLHCINTFVGGGYEGAKPRKQFTFVPCPLLQSAMDYESGFML